MSVPLLVLVPTHGRPTLLGRTLATIAACDRPDGYRGCVVIENGPPAGAEAMAADLASAHPEAGLRYRHVERANKSAALNAALADVPDETLVVFLDDDIRVDPGILAAYASAAVGRRGQAFFGGSARIDYEAPPPDWLVGFFPLSARGMDVGAPDWPGWFLGFNWAAYAEDIRAVGGFDPEVGPGSPTGARGQETDMQNRMTAAGLVATPVPTAVVWHFVPTTRSSPEWVIQRRYQLGAASGRAIADGKRENTIPVELVRAARSLVLLPPFLLVRNTPRVVAHKANVSRAAGLVTGYVSARRENPSAR